MVPYTATLQATMISDKVALGDHFPVPNQQRIVFVPQVTIAFSTPPAESFDDNSDDYNNRDIHDAIADIKLGMREAACCNNPAPVAPSLPSSVDFDASLHVQASRAIATVNTDRLEAKLCLITMQFPDAGDVGLFDVKEGIKNILGLANKVKAEAVCNLLMSNSNKLADSLESVNRQACWPEQFKYTS